MLDFMNAIRAIKGYDPLPYEGAAGRSLRRHQAATQDVEVEQCAREQDRADPTPTRY